MKENSSWLGFLWTPRSGNVAADLIARLPSSPDLPLNWVTTPPRALTALMVSDMMDGCTNGRDLEGGFSIRVYGWW